MKILKAYLYFYWDILISVSAILQYTIFAIGVLFAFIVLEIIKLFKWQTEIESFEDCVMDLVIEISVRLSDWVDKFKYLIK